MEEEIQKQEEITLDGFLDDNEPTTKWTAKASVFTSLFSEAEYTLQLYQALHSEDKTTTKEDLSLMTLESHLLNQQYNDLGFLVGDRLIILVEAQRKPGNREQNIPHLWKPLIKRLSAFCTGKNRERQ